MKSLRFLPAAILVLFALSSCERDITVDIPRAKQAIVVHGHIEPGQTAYVSLNWSQDFFTELNLDTAELLKKVVITGATVTLTDGTQTEVLQPGIKIDNYTLFNYVGKTIRGVPGKNYTLTIEYEGYKLQASTYMPPIKGPDSVWWAPKPNPVTARDSNLVQLWFRYVDPDTPGNAVRVLTKRNHESMFTTDYTSIYEDKIINGKSIDFIINRGRDITQTPDSIKQEEYGYFDKGDTIYVKWATIDRAHADFWRTLEVSKQTSGNPFASPTIILSNIKALPGSAGKGIGVWGAYGTSNIPPLIAR